MTAITDTEVVRACEVLFGNNINKDFIHTMQPSGVKSAYRRKAKENHPDLFAANPVHIQQKQTDRFREIIRAYDTLNLYFKQLEDRPKKANTATPHAPRPDQQKHTASRPSSSSGNDSYYHGNIPLQTLQIGQYLYYRGKITFDALIQSLVWQRKQRPSMGDIALQWGWIDAEGLDKINKACDRQRRFGEKAVELGLLTVFQVNAILLNQSSQQDRLGIYFVQHNMLSEKELDDLARDLKDHNACVLASARPAPQKQAAYA